MPTEKVSVIIPIYNEESYLKKCIDSVLKQTYHNIEVLLVNDGSTDNSFEICKKYAESDKRVIVLNQENMGVSAARNQGIRKSRGKYIVFVDSDDWIEAETIRNLIDIQSNYNYDLVIYGHYKDDLIAKKRDEYKQPKNIIKDKKDISYLLSDLILTERLNALWNKMYKSSIIKNYNISFSEKLNIAEDLLFNFQYFMNVNSLFILGEPYYHYMVREEESLTTKYHPHKYEMLTKVNDYMQLELTTRESYKAALQSTQHIRIKNIYSVFLDLLSKSSHNTRKERLEYIDLIIQKENLSNLNSTQRAYRVLAVILRTKNKYIIYCIVRLIHEIKKGDLNWVK